MNFDNFMVTHDIKFYNYKFEFTQEYYNSVSSRMLTEIIEKQRRYGIRDIADKICNEDNPRWIARYDHDGFRWVYELEPIVILTKEKLERLLYDAYNQGRSKNR